MDNVLSQNLKLDLKMAKSHLKKYSWLETAIYEAMVPVLPGEN